MCIALEAGALADAAAAEERMGRCVRGGRGPMAMVCAGRTGARELEREGEERQGKGIENENEEEKEQHIEAPIVQLTTNPAAADTSTSSTTGSTTPSRIGWCYATSSASYDGGCRWGWVSALVGARVRE